MAFHPEVPLFCTISKKRKKERKKIASEESRSKSPIFDPPFQVWITAEVADSPKRIWDHRENITVEEYKSTKEIKKKKNWTICPRVAELLDQN